MSLYDAIADLPLVIDGYSLDFRERTAAGDFARVSVLKGKQDAQPSESGFTRPCTRISLYDEGVTGVGEDVTYDRGDHQAFVNSLNELPLAGTYTIASFSEVLDEIDLFPTGDPDGEAFRAYRRWAVESAALDLALKQADTDLATALGQEYDPVRFLVSTRLGEPPTADRVTQWLDLILELEFKLDATSAWTADLIDTVAATAAVRIIDLKGQYTGTMVDQSADPVLYRRIIEAFPDTLIEDPILTSETRPLFEGHEHRISWDALITDVPSIQDLPFTPHWLNIKPSRCGTIETLLDVIEHCLDNRIQMYSGGQTELSVGPTAPSRPRIALLSGRAKRHRTPTVQRSGTSARTSNESALAANTGARARMGAIEAPLNQSDTYKKSMKTDPSEILDNISFSHRVQDRGRGPCVDAEIRGSQGLQYVESYRRSENGTDGQKLLSTTSSSHPFYRGCRSAVATLWG